jgi:hypothetical protein
LREWQNQQYQRRLKDHELNTIPSSIGPYGLLSEQEADKAAGTDDNKSRMLNLKRWVKMNLELDIYEVHKTKQLHHI